MNADTNPQANQRGFVLSSWFGRRDNDGSNSSRRRPRQIFRITYWSVFAEWMSTGIALSLLSFYSFALITASKMDEDTLSFKLLSANVILSVYMRMCYIMQSASKTFVLVKEGPIDTTMLPYQSQINSFSCLMGFAEPGHFVCLCWITHISFPFKTCEDLSPGSAVCTSLHITGTIFISMWVFTGLAFIVLIACFARWERNGSRNADISGPLRMAPIPDHVRETIINSLPISDEAPPDGEVCAICCDVGELPTQWRVLPCGHRFHPSCVDEWLKKQGGTCPTCRHDPVQNNTAVAAVVGRPAGLEPPPVLHSAVLEEPNVDSASSLAISPQSATELSRSSPSETAVRPLDSDSDGASLHLEELPSSEPRDASGGSSPLMDADRDAVRLPAQVSDMEETRLTVREDRMPRRSSSADENAVLDWSPDHG